jgi:hypothetical protein
MRKNEKNKDWMSFETSQFVGKFVTQKALVRLQDKMTYFDLLLPE